jgi:hypothetical protein
MASALQILAATSPPSIGDWIGQAVAGPSAAPPSYSGASNGRDSLSAAPPSIAPAGAGSSANQLLALMRQDMSAFGATVGDADISLRKPEPARPMDFFA